MYLKNLILAVLIFWPAVSSAHSLVGSKKSLDRQQQMTRKLKLSRANDVLAINRMLLAQELYSVPREGETFYLDPKIGELDPLYAHLYRTTRPTTLKFLSEISRDFYRRFGGKRLKVTSLIRTVKYQKKLQKRNDNAAKISRSSHLTGAAIDISYKEMTREELSWMRARLRQLERERRIEATEERFQACFHIMVFRS